MSSKPYFLRIVVVKKKKKKKRMSSVTVWHFKGEISSFSVGNHTCVATGILHIINLTLTTLMANSADGKLIVLFFFSQKLGFCISCKLSPKETICMKCQILVSGKYKKYISKCRLLKILPSTQSVKDTIKIHVSCKIHWHNDKCI